MKTGMIVGVVVGTLLTVLVAHADTKVAPSPNGIEFPTGYQDWRVISISHRVDNNTLRVIFGNDMAIAAARAGQTNPWPDGATLGKVVWKQKNNTDWDKAVVPGKFVHAEFMFKNSKKYASTGGWGWARWKGLDQRPYGKNTSVAQECVACHTPVKGNDWVFTRPADLPKVMK